MNNHARKYHGDDGLAAIPTSLRKASARPQQDRPRFLLKEPSPATRKRSFHAVEEDKAMDGVDMAVHSGSGIQNPMSSTYEDIIKCICEFEYDDGNTVYCDTCHTWQHTECYYTDEHGNVPSKDDLEHFCLECKPRPLDAKGAVNRQMKRMEQRAIGRDQRGREKISHQENVARRGRTSSYWSVPEITNLRDLILTHGTNWEAIAKEMKTKTHIMVWQPVFSFRTFAD